MTLDHAPRNPAPRLTVGAWRLRARTKARGPVQPLRLRPTCTAFRTPDRDAQDASIRRKRLIDRAALVAWHIAVCAVTLALTVGALL